MSEQCEQTEDAASVNRTADGYQVILTSGPRLLFLAEVEAPPNVRDIEVPNRLAAGDMGRCVCIDDEPYTVAAHGGTAKLTVEDENYSVDWPDEVLG